MTAGMRAGLKAALLGACLLVSIAGADNWKQGMFDDPFFRDRDRDTAMVVIQQAVRSEGAGSNGRELISETTEFCWKEHTAGYYCGVGMNLFTKHGPEPVSRSIHAGYAQQVGREMSFGVGIERAEYSVVVARTNTRLWGVINSYERVDKVLPHGWIEIGQPFGLAARLQAGPAGVGFTLHWRYWVPKGHVKP
jgi:hypothetical protein